MLRCMLCCVNSTESQFIHGNSVSHAHQYTQCDTGYCDTQRAREWKRDRERKRGKRREREREKTSTKKRVRASEREQVRAVNELQHIIWMWINIVDSHTCIREKKYSFNDVCSSRSLLVYTSPCAHYDRTTRINRSPRSTHRNSTNGRNEKLKWSHWRRDREKREPNSIIQFQCIPYSTPYSTLHPHSRWIHTN